MSDATDPLRLIDAPQEPGRTTATLLGSLMARLATLHLISGATAAGSVIAGMAAVGREVANTAEGGRLRRALEAGRPGVNGAKLWKELRLGDWASSLPPSPVLDQLRNDVALLLAGDLEETFELMPIPAHPAGEAGGGEDEPATFVDYALGLWAVSRELVQAVEALAAPSLEPAGRVVAASAPTAPAPGPILR